MDFREQWEKVDWDFLKQLVGLHNAISLGKKEEKTFDQFVLDNQEKLNNPDYLQVFSERMSPDADYYDEHFEMCHFFYTFMENNPDWQKLEFGLRTFIRLGVFQDTFKEYLEKKNGLSITQNEPKEKLQ